MADGNYTGPVTDPKAETEIPAPPATLATASETTPEPAPKPARIAGDGPRPSRLLALDTASPLVSVALAARAPLPRGSGLAPPVSESPPAGDPSTVLAHRSVELTKSSRRLLEMVDDILEETGLGLAELDAVVALAGPGSFTGLRVGLATVLGVHQALDLPATALPTLDVLAASVATPGNGEPQVQPASRVVALVDVLRGEWAARPYRAGWPPVPEAEAERLATAELARFAPCTFVGFGLGALGEEEALAGLQRLDLLRPEPRPLAPVVARLALDHPPAWEADRLVEPIYFRPPAVTLPKPHKGRRPGEPTQEGEPRAGGEGTEGSGG